MEYRFVSAYKIIGVTPPSEKVEEVLTASTSLKTKATLAYEVNNFLFELNRASAVGNMMLKGLIGQGGDGTFKERLMHEITEFNEGFRKETENGVFVIFEAEGIVDSWNPRRQREIDDFIITFDGAAKYPICEQYNTYINGVLASFALSSDTISGFKVVKEGVYFINDQKKPVYSYTFEMSGNLTVSTGLKPDIVDYVKKNAKTMGRHQELTNSSRLLAQSLDETSDKLFSFISVWCGLEIFIEKVFKTYETETFNRFTIGTNAHPKFFAKIQNVMKSRYRLVDKFSLISSVLAPSQADDDIIEFEKINKIRSKLMHGENVSLKSLPIAQVQGFLRKYLRLHIERL